MRQAEWLSSFELTEIRYTLPTVDTFEGPIADDNFDIDTAQTDEQRQQATDGRASKLWRTLRVASKSKFNLLDKIDDGHNLQALFDHKGAESNGSTENIEEHTAGEDSKGTANGQEAEHNGTTRSDKEYAVTLHLDVNGGDVPKSDSIFPDLAQASVTIEKPSEIPQESIVDQ